MGRHLGWFLKMMGVASGVALAPVTVLVIVVMTGGPPSRGGLTREALIQRANSVSSGGSGG
jgi:hypothetical protein